ncbi:MAG: hypothetical protein JW770_05695 [Actinobacteria bacterium]|nr:hypothetical protein [Actinomycetota bacterium]
MDPVRAPDFLAGSRTESCFEPLKCMKKRCVLSSFIPPVISRQTSPIISSGVVMNMQLPFFAASILFVVNRILPSVSFIMFLAFLSEAGVFEAIAVIWKSGDSLT